MSYASDPQQLVYDFRIALDKYGDEVEGGALKVLQASARMAAQAIVVGNTYGPGVAVDTGFARSTFQVGINAPEPSLTKRPDQTLVQSKTHRSLWSPTAVRSGRGIPVFRETIDYTRLLDVKLGDTIYITSMAEYVPYLEFNPKRRRFGQHKGTSTEFIAPVEARWPQIVDDAATRVGYGR